MTCNYHKPLCHIGEVNRDNALCLSLQKPVSPCTGNLEQVSNTTTCFVLCKFCGSKNVVKDGTKGNARYYLCRNCGDTFAGNDALVGMRFPPDQIAAAVSVFYDGLSIDAIRRQLDSLYDIYPSDSTAYEWVLRFTKLAVQEAQDLDIHVGDIWVADETVLKLDRGVQAWFWDIEDSETRFLIASHLCLTRGTQDAKQLMTKAYQRAKRAPKVIITDKLKSYLDGIEMVFGADTEHVQSQGFTIEPNTNLIERFHGTLKARTKVMRGMHNTETALLIMSFFRPHESLDNKTPGEAAKAKMPHKDWKALVMGDAQRSRTCSCT
ncbi:MAG: DDE-type integrase/transposase/recombinase [Chloroflexi bacterium]|nr:DDE-type integrase/transposase/recombinase [Chloroflexota bacterium]